MVGIGYRKDFAEEFLQSDRWIFERVDDSAGCIGTAYRRACQLFARATAGVASPDVLAKRIALLVEKDDYGVRHSLLEHVPQFWTVKRLPGWWIAGESKRLKGRIRGVTACPC